MSTLRDTATRVAAEIRFRAAMFNHVELERTALRRWATELEAAVKADAEASCQCPPYMLEDLEATGWSVANAGHCVMCGRKTKVTK